MDLVPILDRIPIEKIARKILANQTAYRFAWQFFVYDGEPSQSIDASFVRGVLASIAEDKRCQMMRAADTDNQPVRLQVPPTSTSIRRASDALILTLAAAGSTGVPSQLRGSGRPPRSDVQWTRKTFRQGGDYQAYELNFGDGDAEHFTDWYRSQSKRQWCFFVAWPRFNWIWLGLMDEVEKGG